MADVFWTAFAIFSIGAAADQFLSKKTRLRYANLLFAYRQNFMSEVAGFVISIMDTVFSSRSGSISLLKSAAISTILFFAFAFLASRLQGEGLVNLLSTGSHENKAALAAMLVMNIFADYLSIHQTKYLMSTLIDRAMIIQIFGLILDVFLTTLVVTGCVAVSFWILASAQGAVPGWSWNQPEIVVWQMCYQVDSTITTLSDSKYGISQTCDSIYSISADQTNNRKNFAEVFNTASLLTSYTVTAWVLLFVTSQIFMRLLQKGFVRYSRIITRMVDCDLHPFAITSLFFAFLYLLIFNIAQVFWICCSRSTI